MISRGIYCYATKIGELNQKVLEPCSRVLEFCMIVKIVKMIPLLRVRVLGLGIQGMTTKDYPRGP